ncbi:S8 family serine peptidase [Microbacterium sp.]|uniref:S8 family serine peptidase n=1 Tax=Microbacterium sp. TaxID=51671 RepID=UPI003F9A5EDE
MVHGPAGTPSPVGRKKKMIIIGAAVALAVLAGGALWWALKPAAQHDLGSPEAVSAGEEFAADLVDGDSAVTQRQTVASPDLFHYSFDEEDLAEGADGYPFVANQLVIRTTPEAGLTEAREIADDIGARVVGLNIFLDQYQLLLDEAVAQDDLTALGDEVSQRSGVAAAEENLVTAMGPAEAGGEWAGAWGPALGPDSAGNWGMQALGAPAIWEYADAHEGELAPTTVGVVDAFYKKQWHADLAPDPTSLLPSGEADEDSSTHGLHVSGTIATRHDRPTGIRGVAPNAELSYASTGEIRGDHGGFWGWAGDKVGLIDRVSTDTALTFVVESGAKVVNMSFGATSSEEGRKAQEGDEAVQEKMAQWADDRAEALNGLLERHDFLAVSAAGNDSCIEEEIGNEERVAPCTVVGSFDAGNELKGAAQRTPLGNRLIVVGATTPADGGFEIGWFSNGNADVAAPGTDILSAVADDGYDLKTGTSMAAPHVSGLAVALFGADPQLTAAEAKKLIVGTANAAPAARWDGQDDEKTSAPIANGAAAFQIALMTAEMDEGPRKGFIDQVSSGAVTASDTELPAPLLGTWCAPGENGDGQADCFDLQGHLAEQGGGVQVVVTPDDPTGRESISSTVVLCEEGSCDERDERVQLRYFPPGAVSDAGSGSPAHDVSYPRIAEVAWGEGGNPVMGEPYRLTLGAEGTFPELPFASEERPSLADEALDGAWRPAAGSAPGGVIIRGDDVFRTSGQTEKIFQVTPDDDGTAFVDVIAAGYSSCAAEVGSACAPLGRAIPAGTPAAIPGSYGIADVPDRDRIWNAQSGELLVREPLPSAADFPAELRGEWCAKNDSEECFSVEALLESTPTAFVSGTSDSEEVQGAKDFSLCLVDDLGSGECTTAASQFLRYFPVGTEWDCAEAGRKGELPYGFTSCDPDFTAEHDPSEPRLIVLPNHQHDKQYVDSVPLYRTGDGAGQ